ncbi:uncharacterized protein Triagg1_7571 [Trichoderma aggressivum f. europaeum]|uniref:Uncharacterized protein n=1 Tax=Trichoderma aggressivum f. europaeum TaxID=173218 RepID=A0AAE1LWQ5_9HYPO|nr:hypothetical protein Triagg1_7571 [Trichoderma aggressivum f. europaeum]
MLEANVPEISMSSDKTKATVPPDSEKPILVDAAWPEEWRDDYENPEAHRAKVLADIERRSAYWQSLGVPCIRLSPDKTKIMPTQYVNPEAAKITGDRLDTAYITLKRKSRPGQHDESTCWVIEDGERYPRAPLDFYKNERDNRPVERDPLAPIDVVDESGNSVETLHMPFTREQLGNHAEPLSLDELLKQRDNQEQEAPAGDVPASPKTSDDKE